MNPLQKLRPLVQLLPAAAVAAAVLLTLPHTAPVLAAVPERLTPPAASEPEAGSTPEETPALPGLPYADGVYTGSSRGYGGTVTVQVTMEGGAITDVQIVDARHETAAFLKRSKRLLNTVLEAQTWEVDAVSEATYTSRGILGAVRNALTGEVVNNPLPPQPKTPEAPAVVEEFTPPSAYRDGVYTGEAQGFGGPITLQVTVQNDTITDITILRHEGETSSYFARARQVIPAMLASGSPEADAVSGATYSSTGILNAVRNALAKAAVDDAPAEEETAAETPEAETPAEEAPAAPAEEETAPTPEADASSGATPAWQSPALWEKAKDALAALFPERESEAESTPEVIFRPAEPETPPASEAAPGSEPAPEAAETEETPA